MKSCQHVGSTCAARDVLTELLLGVVARCDSWLTVRLTCASEHDAVSGSRVGHCVESEVERRVEQAVCVFLKAKNVHAGFGFAVVSLL